VAQTATRPPSGSPSRARHFSQGSLKSVKVCARGALPGLGASPAGSVVGGNFNGAPATLPLRASCVSGCLLGQQRRARAAGRLQRVVGRDNAPYSSRHPRQPSPGRCPPVSQGATGPQSLSASLYRPLHGVHKVLHVLGVPALQQLERGQRTPNCSASRSARASGTQVCGQCARCRTPHRACAYVLEWLPCSVALGASVVH
jgi:hypothetical protein